MKKKHKILTVVFLLINLILITIPSSISAQSAIVMVQGYIYINNVITVPDEVSLILPDQIIYASVYDYGNYFLIFPTVEPGTIGTFEVILSDESFTPIENITIEDEVFDYEIDLHIETSDGEPPKDPTNIQPKADAGGPYYQTKNVAVNFDGSDSSDSDGHIAKYEWDFGDGTTAAGISSNHTYQIIGVYRVKLIVTDNKGKTDIDITYAYITETPNNPPSKPIINGTIFGTANIRYNYSILSTDIENDKIQYLIDWGDETDPTVSELLANGTIYQVNHSWKYPGIYRIKSFAIDEGDIVSQPNEQIVLIDTIYCEDLGYLTDYSNDYIYDLFHSNTTGEETPVEQVDDLYLIDDDNDGDFDYQYNTKTEEVSKYALNKDAKEKIPNLLEMINAFVPYILFTALIFSILTILLLIFKIRKIPKKNKVYNVKDKIRIKAKKIISNSKEDRFNNLEKKVDEILHKKKK